MTDIKETIDGLKEIADSKNDSVCEHLKCKKIAENALELLKDQQAEIKALKEEKEKTESNFIEYVDEKREEVEELKAEIKRLEFEMKKYEELVSVLKNKA